MRRGLWLLIGLFASLLWLADSVRWGVGIMAHGGNAAAVAFMACKQPTPADIAGCQQRFQKDFSREVDYRWLLIGARTFAPLAAAWLGAWLLVTFRRAKLYRQPPPPLT